MNNKNYQKLKSEAIKLRKQGLSYNEIKKKINVSKSTLSLWLKAVSLKPEQRKLLYTKQVLILARGPQSQKERRLKEINKIIKEAEKEIQLPLSFEAYRLMGAALYWAEGSKTVHFAITNSDPHFILFMVRWLRKVFGIVPRSLKAKLNIYPQQNESEIKQFWSQLTGIPLESFEKSFIKPLNKKYKKNNLYYGTIRIRVPRGTDKRHQVFAWIKSALKEVAPEVELRQKEWKSLKEVLRPVNLPEKKLNFNLPS